MRERPNRHSYAGRITRAYVLLLCAVVTFISMAIVGIVGVYLVKSKQDDSAQLMAALKESFVDGKPDWDAWLQTGGRARHAYVRVSVIGAETDQTYYSRNTRRFLSDTLTTTPLFSHVQYQENQGVYYYRESIVHKDGQVFDYEIWMSLNNMIELLQVIISAIIGITLVGTVLGAWAISLLARRLNRPLATLTQAASGIVAKDNVTYHERLPEPAGPAEVHALAVEFNRLLHSLNAQVIRDNQFVSDASHELRTPLTAIRGHVTLMRRHGNAHPELVPESLAIIEAESQKMQRLIESLLALSRMDHAQLDRVPLDLAALVPRVVARYQSTQPIQVQLPASLIVLANAESLEQILLGLLNNAHKYTPHDTPITISAAQVGQQVALSVADLGPGIPDDAKSKVFDRFYRVDRSRTKHIPGTGLGLAIAARLAALNGGTITVVDNQPRGSCFIVTLPLANSENL
ncbi:sensor histidine kinase [Lacticaseibacillus daqingensis]|uniref:sensor histidine kinase n=1 Tax=Lacticaseibacillus daqingensis TaxID=2486014 RepID=UPI000F78408B|nr:HAMP domain-containing sensor histidine kinase [Lacticaseibacillus daqingensis]